MATKRKLQVRYGAAASRPTLATGEIGLDSGTGVEKLWIGTPAGNAFVASLNTTGEVKRYVALLSQAGTDAPVATVLENTLGGTVVWGYTGVGIYSATLTGAFTENKTVVRISNFDNGASNTGYPTITTGGRTSSDVVQIVQAAFVDDETVGINTLTCTFEITVYP